MSVASHSANNVKAGVFVLVSLAIGLAVIFILGDLWNKLFGLPETTYRVSFTVRDGVGRLQKGSVVRVGGLNVGSVEGVSLDHNQDPLLGVDVVFSLPSDLALYSNAEAMVQSGLISSDSMLAISSVGWDESHRPDGVPGAAGMRLASGDLLVGTPAGGMLGAMLGPESSQKLASTLDSIAEVTERLRVDGALLQWVLGQTAAGDMQKSLVNLEGLMARIRLDWEGQDGQGGWSKEITAVMASAETLGNIIDAVDSFVNENEANFQSIVNNANATMYEIESTAVPKLTEMLTNGDEAIDDARRSLAEIEAHMPLWTDRIGTLLADLNLAAQQLDLLMQEVRNAPWRLLYQPSEQAVSNELLYEASRNFLFGAADLKSASASLARLVKAHDGVPGTDDRDFQIVRDNLMKSVQRYERAQKQLADILQGNTASPTAP